MPLPEPDGVIAAMWNVVRHGPNYDGRQNDVIAAAKAYAERHAASVSAKDAEIAGLRAELLTGNGRCCMKPQRQVMRKRLPKRRTPPPSVPPTTLRCGSASRCWRMR